MSEPYIVSHVGRDISIVSQRMQPNPKPGILAIDPGLSTGWALLRGDGTGPLNSRVVCAGVLTGEKGDQPHDRLMGLIGAMARGAIVGRFAFEESSAFAGGFTNLLPIELGGVIKAVARINGIEVRGMAPNSVKSYMGSGKLKKKGVKDAVMNIFPDLPTTFRPPNSKRPILIPPHFFDAIAVGLASLMRDGCPRDWR